MPNVSGLKREKRVGSESMMGAGLRRAFSLAVFLSLAVPSLALGQEFNNAGLPIIPFTVVNNFNTTVPLFVYIKGQVNPEDIPANNNLGIKPGDWVFVTDLKGNIDVVPQLPPGYSSLALNLGTAQTTTMKFPKLNGIRIYFSFNAATLVCCNNAVGGPPSEPTGWVPNDPNFNTVFDWAELAWDNGGNKGIGHTTRLGGNLTQVDMFGMPAHLQLIGQSTTMPGPSTQNAGFTSGRPTIFSAYRGLGTPWTNLFVTNPSGVLKNLRVISPYHGIAMGVFPDNALDTYITQVFNFYKANTLMVKAVCPQDMGIVHTLAGNTDPISGDLVFTESGTELFRFAMPSTLTIYQNEIKAKEPITPPREDLKRCLSKVVAAKLGGAFIRTTLLVNTNLDACNTAQFYANDPVQKYAQIFHTFGINHLAYSFGYDDTCDQSSYISVDDPTSMTLSLGGG